MKEYKWIHIPTPSGKPETKARLEILPPGPYVHIPQHKMDEFEKTFAVYPIDDKMVSKEFETRFGCTTYAVELPSGNPMRVAYHWDTSD